MVALYAMMKANGEPRFVEVLIPPVTAMRQLSSIGSKHQVQLRRIDQIRGGKSKSSINIVKITLSSSTHPSEFIAPRGHLSPPPMRP